MKKQEAVCLLGEKKEGEAFISGYAYAVDVGNIARGSRVFFSNFWLQIKGIAELFGQKNFMLKADESGIVLHSLSRFRRIPKSVSSEILWERIAAVSAVRTSIGNDRAICFRLISGDEFVFHFNIAKQKEDFDIIAAIVARRYGTNLNEMKLRTRIS